MAKRKLSTVSESLYWSYSNLAMMVATLTEGLEHPGKNQYKIREQLYSGLRKGTMKIGNFFNDEKVKLKAPSVRWYCGGKEHLSVDHVIPQKKNGAHGGENLIFACRSCNSSKGSKDLLAWMEKRGQFPPLYVLQRYLKMTVEYCKAHDLMEVTFPVDPSVLQDAPFDLDRIPHKYPPPAELCKFILPMDS